MTIGIPAVFFFPHQDDEIITQGAQIQKHLAAGREVIAVAMSDGQSTGVKGLLKSKHNIDLSYSAISKARDREVIDCLTRLGVTRENIYFENLLDSGFTLGVVKSRLEKYFNYFGVASYKSHSWMDLNPDHYMLGRALDELALAGKVPGNDVRFIRSYHYPHAPTPGGRYEAGTDVDQLKYAASAYGVWAPNRFANSSDMGTGPRYSIGFSSLGEGQFMGAVSQNRSFVHQDSSHYTAAGRTAANKWLTSQGHYPFL